MSKEEKSKATSIYLHIRKLHRIDIYRFKYGWRIYKRWEKKRNEESDR